MRKFGMLLAGVLIAAAAYLRHQPQLFFPRDTQPSVDAASTETPCAPPQGGPCYLTRQTCSSTACHGAIAPSANEVGILRNEYHMWFDEDPHSRAARVLGNPVSQRMVEYLVGKKATPEKYQAVYARCLACHNTVVQDVPDYLVTAEAEFDRNPAHEGVGCQACHGKASQWESLHYVKCWDALSNPRKIALGFEDTKSLAQRAALCAKCHVGEAGRDVNHDLIAAGHPQMRFEMVSYHQMLPAHWRRERDRTSKERFEQQLWAAGQIAAVNAALLLLESRAQPAAAEPRLWPEFSEYDCFACHHDLESAWRKERGFEKTEGRVMLPWSDWHYSALPPLAATGAVFTGRAFAEAYQDLRETMQSRFAPNSLEVMQKARVARQALNAWVGEVGEVHIANQLDRWVAASVQDEKFPRSWDEAVQVYLGAYALIEAQRHEADAAQSLPSELHLKELGKRLRFPDRYRSPRFFPMDSLNRGDVRPELKELLNIRP